MSTAPIGPGAPLECVLARWDALVIRWGLDGRERSALLGGIVKGPVDAVATYRIDGVEKRMRLLVELAPLVAAVHREECQARDWLRRPNVNLGGNTPIEMMASSPEWMRSLIRSLGAAS